MKPIRVLHVLQRMEPAGIQTLLMSIYRNVDRDKIQFDFLVHYKTPQFFDDEIEKMGGKVYRMSVREDYNIIKYLRDLNNFFKTHKEYSIVHGHMSVLGCFYLHYAKKYNVPVRIAHSHTNSSIKKGIKKQIVLFLHKLYPKNANYLFACSEAAGKYMFGNKEFLVINNAIDSEKFRFDIKKRDSIRNELNINDKYVVGTVGRLSKQKNQLFSIEVFEEIIKKEKNACLLIIGEGSMEEEIKHVIKEKNLLNNVLLLGNRRDTDKLYCGMDVFLMPSLFEGLGIVGIESQASGIPTVCTDTLPKELNVTPLIHRVSLSKNAKDWADVVIQTKNDKLKHKDTSDYIKNAKYDIKALTDYLQSFYLESIKKND